MRDGIVGTEARDLPGFGGEFSYLIRVIFRPKVKSGLCESEPSGPLGYNARDGWIRTSSPPSLSCDNFWCGRERRVLLECVEMAAVTASTDAQSAGRNSRANRSAFCFFASCSPSPGKVKEKKRRASSGAVMAGCPALRRRRTVLDFHFDAART